MELGRLRREVTTVEPIGEPRKLLLHELASREVCGFDGCPSRMRAKQHMREQGFVLAHKPGSESPDPGHPVSVVGLTMGSGDSVSVTSEDVEG